VTHAVLKTVAAFDRRQNDSPDGQGFTGSAWRVVGTATSGAPVLDSDDDVLSMGRA
jgi:hypothetical protein